MTVALRSMMMFGAICLMAGCVTPPAEKPWNAYVRYLGNALEVREVRTSEEKGFVVVYLAAENMSPFNVKVRYRTTWYDVSGIPVSTVLTRWANRTVAGKSLLEIKAISPRSDVVDYRFEIEDI